jgi:hypothetical protein
MLELVICIASSFGDNKNAMSPNKNNIDILSLNIGVMRFEPFHRFIGKLLFIVLNNMDIVA